ncbi:hypothetical protein Aph01nite_55240 [Acrocarpospora phusangensis]|uniref:Uncharacterized protein n=1 Tax=Acrocarpospora phusangensis TaxID=1070424 RepID=A0A919UMS4_9ACTN|nr:hypothetical protein [Acrocarpospora phusangensis]GIH27214.1 hypothetical protein Aph01nite_55240 [Acrocarpospora phusangensis]
MTEEQRSPTGKPMVPSTPMDVIHIRLGSFALVFCLAVLVLSIVTRLWWLTAIAAILGVFVVVDMIRASRRQGSLGGGPQSEG